MLEDQVAYLLQRYLGNYVRGLNKEALKISVWQGDVELTNMQLKPEALNALKLPVKVKAGFLGSVKLKVPWSRLGQDPVLVSLDRIFLLAEPATQVEGSSEDAIQEVKRNRIREIETKLVESRQMLKTEINKSWLGSLINTVIGNLRLSISNIHIRYEDLESNPGHPFAAGVTLDKLSAFTVDDKGEEAFVTGGALERIQKHVELERMAVYLDSDISPWYVSKPWEDLLPSEWSQIFKFGTVDGKPASGTMEHAYILQPVSGNAMYSKLRADESKRKGQPVQTAVVNLDDVTLCLSKNGYRDVLKLADNFAAFNQRLNYAHYRPHVSVKSDPRSWWKYASKAISDHQKKASGKMSWEQVLRYANLRKKYISLYAALLKSDLDRAVVDDNEDIEELDRGLDIDVILQWRMLAHKFVEETAGADYLKKQKTKKSWWSFGWSSQPAKDDNEPGTLTEEDWNRLNSIIGYKEGGDEDLLSSLDKGDYILLKLHMRHNASKLMDSHSFLADLSCDNLACSIKLYSEAKVVDINLGSYRLLSPNGILAESESASDSLFGVFRYKPLDTDVDWSVVAKASPCYVTYLKDSVDDIINFFESSGSVSQNLARETASAVQMTIDEVKRTAAKQMNRALKERTRFLLDLDIAAPKITIPTDFYPDGVHPTKLLIDLGKLVIRSQDDPDYDSPEEMNMYSQFDLVLRDVFAFLIDGDYSWSNTSSNKANGPSSSSFISYLPVIDKCGAYLKLQQIRSPVASLPSTRLSMRLPSLIFHFSPSRYHRLLQIANIFQGDDANQNDLSRPWDQADFSGWLYILTRKGVGGREAIWQRRYLCIVGQYIYVLENAESRNYKHYYSLRGKQLYQVPSSILGDADNVLAVYDAERSSSKVLEDANALLLRFDSEDSRRTWQSHLQGAIYFASANAPLTGLLESSSDSEDSDDSVGSSMMENIYLSGILDELKISFSYSILADKHDQSLMKLLLAEERPLLEFRAIGGQVELSIRGNDIFVGTILKALEIEDLILRNSISQIRYLARSFIRNAEKPLLLDTSDDPTQCSNDLNQDEGDDEFYEAPENLNDLGSSPMSAGQEHMSSQSIFQSDSSDFKSLSFKRISGLLPFNGVDLDAGQMIKTDALDSFVKAQIVFLNQNSTLYSNVDIKVAVTLSTLSFYCRRPSILAIMEFVSAINAREEHNSEAFIDASSADGATQGTSGEITSGDLPASPLEEPVTKSLLGKGKSRVIFHLLLNMARAEIFLMKEDESKISTLAQDNFLTDIKVFPSSFSIRASLGNLKISDDSLPSSHMYYWVCDMRNAGGNSFVELEFCSYSAEDEDYNGYDYSLLGQLSEVQIVYLNRFIQEIVSYFMGLVPSTPKDVIQIKDQMTNTEKWLTRSEIEGSTAIKLDISLKKPIILMPRRTSSSDYLKLDVIQIAVRNTFRWFGGDKNDINAVHVEILDILVESINLNIGSGMDLGENIIQDIKGVSIVLRRSLRDLSHQIPSIEVSVTIGELKAALSNKEYEIITECAQSNISETPNNVPPLGDGNLPLSTDLVEEGSQSLLPARSENEGTESWQATKVSLRINMVELSLHYGVSRDSPLATLQISGVWLLYKSNSMSEGFLSATLKGLIVVDDREGTEKELRLAIGKPDIYGNNLLESVPEITDDNFVRSSLSGVSVGKYDLPILILDANFRADSTFVSLRIQRPQLLVALDFLIAIVEFFVPTVRDNFSTEDNPSSSPCLEALILDHPIFLQPTAEFSLSPQKPLVVDDERFDHFIYDGQGGSLYLKDRQGLTLSGPSREALIYVGNGKTLQFKNVTFMGGSYLDSCISLGANACFSANENDNVFLTGEDDIPSDPSSGSYNATIPSRSPGSGRSSELIMELQVISPELTFYNKSRDAGQPFLSNKLLHAQMDAFCRLVSKGDTIEMTAETLGFTVESNGIKILEPFDASATLTSSSEKTSIQLAVSDIFMNFSFSILRLFLSVEEDILSFLRTRSQTKTVSCSEFDKIATIKNEISGQIYTFWRARAPTGFAVLGDYLTPIDKPPTKGVIAVNTSLIRVKRPKSFILVWPFSSNDGVVTADESEGDVGCSIWFPEAPKGYVSLGCVASPGRSPPPVSSVFCILASLVSPCVLRDCVSLESSSRNPNVAFWRVDNASGTFLPADLSSLTLSRKAYELRHLYFGFREVTSGDLKALENQSSSSNGNDTVQSERSSAVSSRRRVGMVATFRLIWWNQGSGSRKKLSVWRPVVPEGMVYFGDIAVQGYEPPNTCMVVQDSEDLFRPPSDFQLVGHVKRQRKTDYMSFWMPQAPPGFASLGCVASKGSPKQSDFSSLRCIRSDMVSTDQFLDESIWDTSETKFIKDPFSIWLVGNELGTFIAWNGYKKPPRRFAFKFVGPDTTSGSDDTLVDAEIRTFSATLFDDYGGLMVPLCNISLSGIWFSLHGRPDSLNSNVTFSLTARSFNDKYESWEPLIELVDGSLRYESNPNAPGVASQLRITSTTDLNLNVSVSNANMILQAYASWNNLGLVDDSNRETESPSTSRSMIAVHQKKNYYVVPQNKLGQDVFIRIFGNQGLPGIVKFSAGDQKALKVSIPKNMLDSHLKGSQLVKSRLMLTVIIAEAEFPKLEGLSSHQYSVGVRLYKDHSNANHTCINQQTARTSGIDPCVTQSSDSECTKWNEVFYFKIDSMDNYLLEFTLTETGSGKIVGYHSSSLSCLGETKGNLDSHSDVKQFMWLELSSGESALDPRSRYFGRIRCAVVLPHRLESGKFKKSSNRYGKHGSIQISPSKDGPWTTLRLNYGAPVACLKLGNDVVASEVSVTDGNRYVSVRSLVSVHNSTDVTLELCLSPRPSNGDLNPVNCQREESPFSGNELATNELFESEKYNSSSGWVPCTDFKEEMSGVQLPPGWEWIDEWHVDDPSDKASDDRWVYATETERQRRWIRNRKRVAQDIGSQITVGHIQPGERVPLPLPCLANSSFYVLQLKPSDTNQYSWSCVMDKSSDSTDVEKSKSETCLSALTESEELVFCSELSGSSSNSTRGVWFCLSMQGTEIGKDIHFNPIKDWTIVVRPPVTIANYLPVMAEISLLEMQASGHFSSSYRGVFGPGENVKIYGADIRNPLYCSLLPQKGWLPLHEAVLMSHPHNPPAKTISLRSAVSGRVVQIILEHNHTNERFLQPKLVKVYSPYWFGVARCPPLCFRLIDANAKRSKKNPFSLKNKKKDDVILEEITEEEIRDGYTIASALNFKSLSLSASIAISNEEQFGPVKDLSPLGDMDGSLDLFAYDAEGNCLQLFVSSKPCPYQSVPTKVIYVRPFMTFTNRVGENMLLKFNSEDEPKALRVSDTRVSFARRKADKPDELQVKLNDTDWSFPIQIVKEDTITLVLKKHDGTRRFLRTEIRGYEEGSRFIVVFRLGSTHGPIRIENRTMSSVVRLRQVGFGDDSWIQLQTLSTVNFSWEDPYGQKVIDAEVCNGNNTAFYKLDLDKAGFSSIDSNTGLFLHIATSGKTKVVRFLDQYSLMSKSKEGSGSITVENWGDYAAQAETSDKGSPLELILELGVLGVSIVDHKPRELAYLYMEKFFISYSTGYDGGTTSRFKLILGYLQLDNQLPLTVMPVLLAPEQTPDVHHPVFKMTITMRNENLDGLQIYPYVYIRVTDKSWRLNIHEPIIWALVDFFNNLQLGRIPEESGVTQVDPEIRVDLIDISEVRLRVSLETAPAERPHGLLGVWGPVLTAVGNAFKIQVHLRKVTHRDRFLRKSSVISAVGNRLWRDLIHNPLHLLFSVDVLGMASSTLASLGKGFAELSTDGQFLQLRSKQVWSRRITGVGDGIVQGTEALAQGVAFGVSGVVRKPVESARQNGLLGLVHGLGQACLGIFVQPVSGALDFFSLTVDGIGASCSRCIEILSNKKHAERIRNPRAFHADNVLKEYSEREAVGQMILFLAEASRNFGCTEIFKEPSKFAWTDCYEEHFVVPYQRIVLVTNRRVMLLQCVAPDKMDSKPCKIMWDVPWQEVLSLELAKSGYSKPSHLIIHLKSFKRGENFVRVIKCNTDQLPEETEPQAVKICSAVRMMWKAYQNDMKQVSSSQGHLSPAWGEIDARESHKKHRTIITSMDISSSSSSTTDDQRFCIHSINFSRVWSSERESKGRCNLCRKQNSDKDEQCTIWRPICPDGYISIGDIARPGSHPPNVAAVYRYSDELFAVPVGYDLVWRNCSDDYKRPVSIWYPRAPPGFVSLGCVAVPDFEEPKLNTVYCVAESLCQETTFEEQKIWSSPDSYPWACYIYQSQSEALQFVALRRPREDSDHKPKRVADNSNNNSSGNDNGSGGQTSNSQ